VQRRLGEGILSAAPWLMKGLSIAGTAAMFLVGGGILVHGVPALHHAVEAFTKPLPPVLAAIGPTLADAVAGVVAGAVVLAVVSGVKAIWSGARPQAG
jgi:predicted DNA repair protein MutK